MNIGEAQSKTYEVKAYAIIENYHGNDIEETILVEVQADDPQSAMDQVANDCNCEYQCEPFKATEVDDDLLGEKETE